MRGDSIVIEEHHRQAAIALLPVLLEAVINSEKKYTFTVAGESGSGKSETAKAIARALNDSDIATFIFQQDDYFIHPPKSNDRERRSDISKVGVHEVKMDLLDSHLLAFRDNAVRIEKPLVDYESDSIGSEEIEVSGIRVGIAEGTYTSLLENVDMRIFIARDYIQTLAHREKRKRNASELDPFIDDVLKIEHKIISAHRARASIVINADFSVSFIV